MRDQSDVTRVNLATGSNHTDVFHIDLFNKHLRIPLISEVRETGKKRALFGHGMTFAKESLQSPPSWYKEVTMLVLSRRVGQEIFIGDIRLIVVGHDGRRVRLAIDAPPDVRILRQELVEQNAEPSIAGRTFEAEVALT